MSVFTLSNPHIAKLVGISKTLRHLQSISGLLSWDQETYLPPKGAYDRAGQLETLAAIIHTKSTSRQLGNLLMRLSEDIQNSPMDFTPADTALIRAMMRDFTLATKLSPKLVAALSRHCSLSLESWKHARTQNNFAVFSPDLARMIELKKEVAYSYGYTQSPYDALLSEYEEGLTAKTVDHVFTEFLEKLTPLTGTLVEKTRGWDKGIFSKHFDTEKLLHITLQILDRIGFDRARGRQDESTHPFTMGITPQDVRLTTRALANQPLSTILSSIHEGGHGMYEQGVAPEIAATRLGVIDSLVLHESQSRFFENMIGKSQAFWEYLFPLLQATFPAQLSGVSMLDAYHEANIVRRSLIRVDADEVTYHFHIAIRFLIERDLIEGKLAVSDIPERWKELYKKYLGIDVPDDLSGALQDIHWSQGLIGYFPTYSLGSFLSVQLFRAMERDVASIDRDLRQGRFDRVNAWLKDSIHTHGKMANSDTIAVKLTGKNLGAADFISSIKHKFSV